MSANTFQCYNCKKMIPETERDWSFYRNVAPLRVCRKCAEVWGHEIYQYWRDHDLNNERGR